MHKSERQKTIVNVISATRIGNQTDLVRLLRKNGFTVTQASISRDLVELGIVKVNGKYTTPARIESSNPFGLTSLEPAGQNLIVARCASGLASAAAVRIDAAGISAIAGTIAGDDTIFIALRDSNELRMTIKSLWELFD
ncbi:MAG: arginine repressor [Blastocatellia bacterium]